jgi:hypothetical protein
MPTSLRQKLSDLASSFAQDVLQAVRLAPIDELGVGSTGQGRGAGPGRGAAPASRSNTLEGARASAPDEEGEAAPSPSSGRARPASGGRLGRRSAADIAHVIDRITALLRQSPKGLRAEQIRQNLGLQAKELPRPLKEGFEGGRFGKSGEKRATTYVLKGAAPSASPAAGAGAASAAGPRRGRARGARTAAKKKK